MKKMIPRQKIWLVIMIIANGLVWAIPSDVIENIARDHHTLLGRYSRQHFTAAIGLLLFTFLSFYVDWSTGETYKRRWFQVLAVLIFLGPSLLLVDFLARIGSGGHYVRDTVAYHRPPGFTLSMDIVDKPEAALTFPDAPDGFPTAYCTLTADGRGYRNQSDLETYDIVVLGDSFAEGSNVSNESTWPNQLAQKLNMSVYNLGMSGYAPLHYMASLKEHGLALKPKIVLCGLYEGNDFRSSKSDGKSLKPSFSKQMKTYFKKSPLINGFDKWVIGTFGPINAGRQVDGVDVLNWLPITIPDGPGGRHYAFAPKQMRDLYESEEEFSIDKHWLNPRGQLEEMSRICKEAGATFVVVYCPLKAHVTLPVVIDDVPADKIRAFMALRHKKSLPDAETFVSELRERADDRETVVTSWCRQQAIPVVSVTEPLRQAAIAGAQVYFTYDQHWTPDGHRVVAEEVARTIREWSPQTAGLENGQPGDIVMKADEE